MSFSLWSFTGICVTANLLRSLGCFWVFWPILKLWVWMVLILSLISNSSNCLSKPFQAHQLQLVSPSSKCFNFYLFLWQSTNVYLSFCFSFFFFVLCFFGGEGFCFVLFCFLFVWGGLFFVLFFSCALCRPLKRQTLLDGEFFLYCFCANFRSRIFALIDPYGIFRSTFSFEVSLS